MVGRASGDAHLSSISINPQQAGGSDTVRGSLPDAHSNSMVSGLHVVECSGNILDDDKLAFIIQYLVIKSRSTYGVHWNHFVCYCGELNNDPYYCRI